MASAVTSSADLLPGKARAQARREPGSRARVCPPLPATAAHAPGPQGQGQMNRKDASAAIGALARRELLPLSPVSGDQGLTKPVLWPRSCNKMDELSSFMHFHCGFFKNNSWKSAISRRECNRCYGLKSCWRASLARGNARCSAYCETREK